MNCQLLIKIYTVLRGLAAISFQTIGNVITRHQGRLTVKAYLQTVGNWSLPTARQPFLLDK